MKGRVWTLTQTEDTLWYHVYKNQERQSKMHDRKRKTIVSVQEDKPKKKFKTELKMEDAESLDVTLLHDYGEEKEMLRDYFQLDVNLSDLYKKWGDADPHFRCIANVFTGLCVCVWLSFYYIMIGIKAVIVIYIHILSLSRCANAATGPHRMPVFIHLHLQQPHLSYPGHGRAAVPGSRDLTLQTG